MRFIEEEEMSDMCRHQREKLLGQPQTGACYGPVALRVADLKPPQHAICVAVWRAWADGRTVSYREVARTVGLSLSATAEWITGKTDWSGWSRPGLVEKAFLSKDGWSDRTLTPGPRMAGVQGGKVLVLSNE